jgi:cysteinyl-tRNA synthetase
MEVKENLKTLANSILDSYEKRVKTVNVLMEQSYHFFKEYQLELDEMMEQLKDNLARVESLRKRDFDRMMKDITERQRSQEDGAEEVFDHFKDEETEMIGRLRKIIISGNRSNLEDVEAIREDILKRQKERENSIIRVIKRFRVEQRELGIALKRLLSKGEYVRIKDFKLMLKSLSAQHGIQDTELDDMMEDLEIARNWVQAEWQAVSRASG